MAARPPRWSKNSTTIRRNCVLSLQETRLQAPVLDMAAIALPSGSPETSTVLADGRDGKVLIDATRPFAVESRVTSWLHLLTAFGLAGLGTAIAGRTSLHWGVRLAAAVIDGLLVVRLFILYHDHFHGALLRDSKLAHALLSVYGCLVLAPPRVWRETHNYHHAHTAQIVGSHIGSFAMVTTDLWPTLTKRQQRYYKIIRHPLTILFGYFPIFMFGMCIRSLQRSVKKHPDSAAALLMNLMLTVGTLYFFGWQTFLFAFFLPLAIACASGGYLFYAQHNFPEVVVMPRHQWSYTQAALRSSSYMPMNPVMRWFTGNIGYHHVHHLNSSIPFYRLPEAMAAIPELQHPGRTSLSPWDIHRCLTLKLWDAKLGKMVGYPS